MKSAADSEAAFLPEQESGCSGKISLPRGRSMDWQIHHHVRHAFRDIQVLPESLLCIAGMHENGMPAKICSGASGSSLLPPPRPDVRLTARVRPDIYVLQPPRPCGAHASGRARRRRTACLRRAERERLFTENGGFVRTPAWGRGGRLPRRPILRAEKETI